MNKKLKFGLSQIGSHAPLWLVNLTSLLALLVAAKHYLIAGLPVDNEQLKIELMAWTNYILDGLQVLLAMTVIFSSEQKHIEDDHA